MFGKRIFTVPTFMASLHDVLLHLGDLWRAVQSGRVDKAFAERVMLAVTQVNSCRYCTLVHTETAPMAGVRPEEIRAISTHEFGSVPPDQVAALMFAQHYAETSGQPDPEAWQRLIDSYGLDTARDVMVCPYDQPRQSMGNTVDALLSRWHFEI